MSLTNHKICIHHKGILELQYDTLIIVKSSLNIIILTLHVYFEIKIKKCDDTKLYMTII